MTDSDHLGDIPLGSISHALGKLEAKAEESDKQRAKLFDKVDEVRELVVRLSHDVAASNAALLQTVSQNALKIADHEARVKLLEEAQQQRRGALFLGRALWAALAAAAAAGATLIEFRHR